MKSRIGNLGTSLGGAFPRGHTGVRQEVADPEDSPRPGEARTGLTCLVV